MKLLGLAACTTCLLLTLGGCRQEAQVARVETQADNQAAQQVPDCSGVDRWPTVMAFGELKNAGITDNQRLDFTRTKTTRLASEQVKEGLFRQLHHVTFVEKSGTNIEVITANDVSKEECSMSGVEVYVISKHLGPN